MKAFFGKVGGMRRYYVLLSALLMQLCLGATYSWSVYVKPLRDITFMSQSEAQLPFSVFYFVFPATMVFSGYFLRKFGPRIATITGGILFGSGWIVSSFGHNTFLFTILGNGIIAGVGAGIAYIVPIATCMKWFPKNKGLVTGFAVAGFGGGTALVSQLAGFLLRNYSPFVIFSFLGVTFSALILTASIFMTNPPEEVETKDVGVSFWNFDIFKDKSFLILYFGMFTGLSAGFAVNANLKEIYATSTISIGVMGVSLFAISNAFGRIIWGFLFDKSRSSVVLVVNLLLQCFLLLISRFVLTSDMGFLMFASITGFNYGGVLVLYAGTVSRIWGPKDMGRIYGALFSSNIPGALAPLFAGYMFDISGSFSSGFLTIGILICFSAFFIFKNSYLIDKKLQV